MATTKGILYLDSDFRREVQKSIARCEHSVEILVGYAKIAAIHWLASAITDRKLKVSIVVGWSMNDLAGGSSDVLAYREATELGWKFGIRPGLHAKIFWLDRDELLIGSANLTPRGLHLGHIANIEAGVRVTPENVDKAKLARLLDRSIWLDDDLYAEIEQKLASHRSDDSTNKEDVNWPESIEEKLAAMEKILWVDDFFMTKPDYFHSHINTKDPIVQHDLTLLGQARYAPAREEVQAAMSTTTAISWLKMVLEDEAEGAARFGRLTALLHDALLDDPKPYRSNVKELLSNLIAWIEFAEMPDFEVIKHKHTRSVKLRI